MDDPQPAKRRFQFRLSFMLAMTVMLAMAFAGYRLGGQIFLRWWDESYGTAQGTLMLATAYFLPSILVGVVMFAGRDGAQQWGGAAMIFASVAIWVVEIVFLLAGWTESPLPYYLLGNFGFGRLALYGVCTATARMLWARFSFTWCAVGVMAFFLIGWDVGVLVGAVNTPIHPLKLF